MDFVVEKKYPKDGENYSLRSFNLFPLPNVKAIRSKIKYVGYTVYMAQSRSTYQHFDLKHSKEETSIYLSVSLCLYIYIYIYIYICVCVCVCVCVDTRIILK
jgi:hypothetical protein